MNKKLFALFLVPFFAISSCALGPVVAPVEDDSLTTIPPYTPPEPPEQAKNIDSIEILGIPDDYKIGMGLFNQANIRCKINYTDGTDYTYQLLEEELPYALREMLGVEGEHNITVQVRNKTATFKIIMVDEGIRYFVRFLNYNEDTITTIKVLPMNKAHYNEDNPKRMSDMVYKYKFTGWDYDLDTYLVDKNTDIHAQYEPVMRINDYLPIVKGSQFVSEYKGYIPDWNFERHYVSHYVGRISRFPIARDTASDYVTHTYGNKEIINYGFDDRDTPIDPDVTSPYSGYHPNIMYTMPGVIRQSYKYVAPTDIDEKYIPVSPELINFASLDTIPMELHSVRSKNSEGKTYDTSVSNYVDVITDYLSNYVDGTLYIPEDFPDGEYTATIFMDIDIYAVVYAEYRETTGISKSGIYAVACPAEIYVGLNSKENEIGSFKYTTSTFEEDLMGIELFANMMKEARSVYEE